MCRMLGIVASEPTDFKVCLREAPRSLRFLSREHPHGWGLGVYSTGAGWAVKKHAACAHEDDRFYEVASGSRGELLLAHVRKGTVGPVSIENTHPFHRGRWVFAHNGTIDETAWLSQHVSDRRRAEITGQTDSELLLALMLTRFDAAGVDAEASVDAASRVVSAIVRELGARPSLGACNFLLSDGESLYGYRRGRTLFVLERGPRDEIRVQRRSTETGAVVDTPWTSRRAAVLIASERMTDEPWREVEEGTLIRVTRSPGPTLSVLHAQ